MADPFLGMFEGGNSLDDLGLGPSLAPFVNQATQSQDRIQQSFPSSQSQQSVTNQAHKLQHFVEERPSGTSQFLPPSQKLQHFNDPLLSSSSQPFQSSPQQFSQLQNRSPSQFPSSSQGSQMNTQAWRGKSSSNFSSQFASSPISSVEQGPFRQPFSYGFQRSPSPRLKHFMNSPQSSQSPGLQSQSRSPMPYSSSSSPQRSSPKQFDQQQQQQMSPQQPLRHYMNSEIGSHQAELATQKRLQHMAASASVDSPTSGTANSGSFQNQNPGDQPAFGSFYGGPHESIQNDSSGVEQGALFNSNQFSGQGVEQYSANMLTMSANDSQSGFPREGQSQAMSSSQRYPLTDFNMSDSPGFFSVKTSSVLLQMQRIQQQIQQMRELGHLNQLAQLQHRFQQLYQIYVMQEQQRMQQGYSGQHPEQLHMIRQQQQQKANRIVVEAMAKAALHNTANAFSVGGMPQMPPGPRMMAMQRFANQFTEATHMQQSPKPLELGPSLVHKPLPSRAFSSRPPATVLSKPAPIRNRRDSSDAEPSPPSSPNYVNEEEMPSSITRRSLRERKKKVYKDDYDYNLSDEEGDQQKPETKVQEEHMLPPTTHVPEENEETMIVEKILAMKTIEVNGQPSEEFLVKYKNYSYMHAEWASVAKLAKGDKRIHMKLKRYRQKQQNSMTLFNELEEEPFNPDYVEVDRVLDMSVGVDQHSGEQITHYLVKWRSLPYDESTWEIESDVDDAKIQQFLKLRELPPPAMTQFRPRPYPHEWRKLENTRVYNGENVLRDYQLEGLNWLTFCWCNRQNSILADEMGLGKTIQSISFLSEVQRYGIRGPFLVIAPLSTISNWQREFETWTDINAVVYHGSASSRHLLQEYEFYYRNEQGQPVPGIFKFEAMVTTYEIIIADNIQLSSVPWRCVVIDEAHRLKNRNCKLLEGLNNLSMEHRILLTGTPLQNNVDELFSLLNFLEPSQFPSQAAFLYEFGNLRTETQVERLKMLLKPMMLRRLKEDVEKNIAPKEETIIEVELTTIQKKFYRAILERNFAFLSKGTSSAANVPNLMNTMMELRKCCNHPFLINGAEEKVLGEYSIPLTEKSNRHANIMIEASGKLVLIHKLLPKLKSGGHKVLIFSQMVRCLDILEDYLVHMKFPYERIDGRVRGNLRQAAIDRFSKPDSDRFVFLLCTRAGGLGINLTAADTVIIFDSDWNPQNDIQAQARCHRIGQSRSVKVYRLITRNSYEREMFDRASLKLGLDKAVLQSMNTKENASNAQSLSKKEIEDLLKKGAYGAVMDEDSDDGNKFCEEDIDQILSRRTQVIQLESGIKGSTFAKASFVSSKGEEDIDVDDPDFWQKWAKKADLDVDALMNKDNRIIDAPRQRKQTKRYGNEDGDFELSDLEPEEEDLPAPRRSAWTRVECFRVEKNLLVYGWGRWKEILSSGRFKSKLAERDVEAVARTILVYCLHFYKGDDKVKTFIKDLVKASTIRERLPSEERDATYTPVPAVSKGKGRGKRGRAGKSSNKSTIALVELGNDWRTCDPNTLVLDEGYRKHLQHHCNKILLRVRLLFYLKTNVIGYLSYKIKEGCKYSELPITIYPPEGDPPCDWWDEECDKSLLIGVYKHGYEHYSLMQADATLCFLSRVGFPKNVARADPLDPDLRDDDDQKDDPDYQEPDGQSQRDEDDDDDEEFKDTVSAVSSPAAEKRAEGSENCNTGLRWPAASDLNTRLRRLIAGYQRVVKKEQLKKAAAEKERERKEKFEEAIRQKELKRAEMAQKWSKREEVDFYRTVTTFGVEYNRKNNTYDWTRFRRLARLDKKNDSRLTAYYLDFVAMCRRVCGRASDEDRDRSESVVEPISEERANRCLNRMRLLSKIREEVLPHEALDEHLALAQASPEFPDWWECGKHDKDLLLGVSKHGLSRTDYNVVNDPELSFVEVLAKFAAAQQLGAPQGPEETATPGTTNKVRSVVPSEEPSTLGASGVDVQSAPDKSSLLQILLTSEGAGAINKEPFPMPGYVNPTTASSPPSEKSVPEPGSPRADPVELKSPREQSMFVLPPAAVPDDGAAVQDNEPTDGEPLGGHLTPAVLGANMAAADEDSHISFTPDPGQSVAGVADIAALSSMRWPKDKVVMQRLELLCECVLKGKWPQVDKQECLLQSQLAVPSPSMMAFPALADVDMSGLPTGSLGENGDDPSKAFKVKRLDGLKLTFKKNKRRKKREGDDGSEDSLTEMEPKRKGPHAGGFEMDQEWAETLQWDLPAGTDLKPPRKKRAYKKDKGDKLGMGGPLKKRVRKPKAPKLGSAGEYMNAGAAQAPGGVSPQQEWPAYHPYPGNQVDPIPPGLHSPRAGTATPGFDFIPQAARETSEPAEPSELHSQRIVVIERESGKKLMGSAAPTLANLAEWLERNNSFDVAEESSALVREKGDLPEALLARVIPASNSRTSTPGTPRQFQVGYGEQSSFTPPAGAYPFDSGSFGGFHAFGTYGAMPYQYGMPMAHSMNQNHGKQGNSPTSPNPVGSSQFMISNSSYSPMLAQQQRQSPQQAVNPPHGFAPATLPSAGAFSYSAVNNGRPTQSPFPVTRENDSLDLKNNASPTGSGGSDLSTGSSPGDMSS